MNPATKVIVGMSGGVDSSVTALLLQQQGYTVEGLFMKNWDEDDGSEYCTAKADLADAQAVADKLGIPLHTANFATEYWDNVFEHFLAEYQAGRTPNPDILCNREIKFKVFLDYATLLGAEKIATGHYCRTGNNNAGNTTLLKGLDPAKDQSYFLHAVTATALSRTLFPIGEMEKTAVRKLADQYGLATARKKDSTGICFIGERRFKDFLERYLPAQPGDIFTAEGKPLGQHTGLMYYTIGQRQGLGIGGVKDASEDPWYVVDKDLHNNRLIVAQGEHPALYATALSCSQLHWINLPAPDAQTTLHCKIRYRQDDQVCHITYLTDGQVRVDFASPQRAITPGQSIVFYQDDTCLGGGIIDAKISTEHA
ncbi:MAG: tRNA 2-thiouridine(34) synthase MnmA [Pseudomonadales bacterium]|nr:tRNA 2-thiouridine(34) synthase MnmA [Pseudomonadales bacterium]